MRPSFVACLLLAFSTAGIAAPPVPVSVVLLVHVAATGHATQATVIQSSGSPERDAKAVSVAMQWHFNPPMVDGKAVEANVRIPVAFSPGYPKKAAP